MKKTTTITALALLAALSGLAQAQTAAPAATPSTDPVVQMRTEKRDANQVYREASTAARQQRDAKVNAAVDAALKDPKAQGKDPAVVRREARSQARAATRPDHDAQMAAARKERDAARAAARAPAATAKP